MYKLVGEFVLRHICDENGIPLMIFRLPGIYGFDDQHQHVVNEFIKLCLAGTKLKIYGDGSDLRDYVFVEDLCLLIETTILQKVGGVLNVASGESFSILQIAEMICELSLSKSRPTFEPRVYLPNHYSFDTVKLKEAFPHNRVRSVKEVLRKMIPERILCCEQGKNLEIY
jgi:UDP-glucose 4-epimerase